jgi:hypothetical protein
MELMSIMAFEKVGWTRVECSWFHQWRLGKRPNLHVYSKCCGYKVLSCHFSHLYLLVAKFIDPCQNENHFLRWGGVEDFFSSIAIHGLLKYVILIIIGSIQPKKLLRASVRPWWFFGLWPCSVKASVQMSLIISSFNCQCHVLQTIDTVTHIL